MSDYFDEAQAVKIILLKQDDDGNWIPVTDPSAGGGGGGGGVTSVNGLVGAVDLSTTYQPLDSDLTAIAALSTTAFGRALLAAADLAAALTALGLDTDLGTLSLPASTTISAYGKTLTDDADAATARTTLGLGTAATTASTDYQPIDSDLTAIAALTTTPFGLSLLVDATAAAHRVTVGAAGYGDVVAVRNLKISF